jgi:plasmid maintenance system antidote protein VapI
VLNEKAGISTDMAIRLELAGASAARAWFAMPASYDLAQAKKHKQPQVKTLADAAT